MSALTVEMGVGAQMMWGVRKSLLVAGVVGMFTTVVAGGAPASASPVPKAPGCGPVHYFFVGGTSDPIGSEYRHFWPHDAGRTTVIEYPALLMQASWDVGAQLLRSSVAGYQVTCPTTALELRGYSQGAGIAGDVAEEMGLAATLIADPRRPTDKETGRGGVIGVSDPSVLPQVSGGMPWRPNRTPDPLVTEICLTGDGICDSMGVHRGDPADSLETTFGWATKHTAYSARDVASAHADEDNLVTTAETHFVFAH
ncbi:hypothetical protein GCM10027169_32510 [Gordonia jinhuaensis]|uniref:Cutinase n=1 Tax=Gordonia jinhuaensis TaxID=1517702 RepID=A0A916T7A2_9ACTN|nr:cutinase family protein [Gordonia jinhuaensis]GGB33179.1 hypothetical protein GCM10011489_21650 [Gordonia jinhuaensis]